MNGILLSKWTLPHLHIAVYIPIWTSEHFKSKLFLNWDLLHAKLNSH